MSDNETNISATTTADYSAYYDEATNNYSPCSFDYVQNFGSVFLPTLYSLVFIFGVIGNGLVVCVLTKHRSQSNLTDVCLLNLALSDLLFVVTLPFYAHYAVVKEWTTGEFMCRFVSGFHLIGFFSSIFFLVVMTLDRYVVIMHAHRVAGHRTVRTAVALSAVVWFLSTCVSMPGFVFTKMINDSQQSCLYAPDNKSWHYYTLITTNILGLVIPLLVMVVCYARIIPTLVNMRTVKKHRAVKLIILIMALFFLFWAPYNISLFLRFMVNESILKSYCDLDNNLKLLMTVTEAIAYTHCCLNPIIYAFVGQRFMKRALQLLGKCVPGMHFHSTRESDSSFRKSSVMSRSSDVTSTYIM
ncbi:C-C chemokine receptor type 2-like isoform X2 [Mastacembelus armatus]|uniref:Si:ch211-207g17.3 n=1 Tax=Mastacembelus armatus TaxID=205130 RepID=A0A3Q3NHV7_9TELE|nr:C-C chemokine receptor type 2-like isoform X2 [Mastacembelus armatus]